MHGCATFASMLGQGIAKKAANGVRCMGAGNVVTRVELDDYVDTILAVAKEIGAGMIVVGGVADPPMSHRFRRYSRLDGGKSGKGRRLDFVDRGVVGAKALHHHLP